MKKLLLLVLIVFILVSCGNKNEASYNYDGSSSFNKNEEAQDYSYVDEDNYDEENNSFKGEKLTYASDISLETKNYDESIKLLNEKIKKYECQTISRIENDYDNYWYTSTNNKSNRGRILSLELRIDVKKFDTFLNEINDLNAHISSINVYAENKTKQYNDNTLKIKELEVQQERLLELLNMANNITEILEIEDRLTNVRYQLKQLNENNNDIDYDVQYSKINIKLKEVFSYTENNKSFLNRLIDAISESLYNFIDWLEDLIITLIFMLPYIILLIILIFIINYIRKKKGKEKINIKNIFKKKDKKENNS